MADQIPETMEWLAGQLETTLACTVIKGQPSWNRLPISPPMASFEMYGLQSRKSQRVGEPNSLAIIPVRIVIYGKNEPDKWHLAQLMANWLESAPHGTANDKKVGVGFMECNPFQSLNDLEQERYALEFIVGVTW